MVHKGSFGITSPREFFDQMVMPQYEEFLENTASSRAALICLMVAYHMYEWVNNQETFSIAAFEKRYSDEASVAQAFELAKNITNSTKHFVKKPGETRTQPGFSPEFSDEFARPLVIIREDYSEISADSLIRELVEFWRNRRADGSF